jgi:hypothetical protein
LRPLHQLGTDPFICDAASVRDGRIQDGDSCDGDSCDGDSCDDDIINEGIHCDEVDDGKIECKRMDDSVDDESNG